MIDANLSNHVLVGATTGLSLIVAIGAQNAYVLKQGIIGRFVAPIVAFCILSDALLIGLGIVGLGYLLESAPWVLQVFRWGGALFLLWYGLSAARRALKPASLTVDLSEAGPKSVFQALLVAGAMTYLNPHAYLDTVILLGSLANQHGPEGRWWFYAGTVAGSVLWFTLLGFGARYLRPFFEKQTAWRVLDALIACVMFFLAVKIILMH